MRIGLLGTGPWAQLVHAPVLAAHPEVEFAGVWGRRPEAAGALADAHGVPSFEELDDLLRTVDAVSIALPPSVQADLAVRAAEAGCHLLLDKPIALTVEQAGRLVDATKLHEVGSVVFFTHRFAAEQSAWIAEQAAAGGWFTGYARWLGSVFTSDSPFAASPWRREKGALWDVGPHALSVLVPVLGEVTQITAVAGPADTVHLVLQHSGGASSTVALSLTAPPEAQGSTVEFRGRAGVTQLPAMDGGAAPALHRAVDALRSAASTGEPDACDAAFGLRVVQVLAAAEESLAAGRTVKL